MGRKKKYHEPIEDSFDNVLDAILKVDVENKRITKKEKKNQETTEKSNKTNLNEK